MFLTSDGKMIFQDIEAGLNAFILAEKKIRDINSLISGTIRLGVSTTLTKTYLMPFIRDFHKKHPKIIFEISTDPTSILKKELKQGKLDFIVAKFPPVMKDDFEYIAIGNMQDILIVNKDYKNLIGEELKLEELLNYPILLQKMPSSSREYIESFCKKHHFKMNQIMEIASSNLLIEFTKIGYGIGVVTKQYVEKELRKKELFELNVTPNIPKRQFGIISLKNNYLSKGAMEFFKFLIKEEQEKLGK